MLQNLSLRPKLALIGLGPLLVLLVLAFLSDNPSVGLLGVVVGALLMVGATIAVSKSITGSLTALREEVTRVADSDLPQLAASLRTGTPVPADFDEQRGLTGIGDDEFGEVASGLRSIRQSAVGLSSQVAELQNGISDTFVNLARRNQSLLDRQLEAIDTLEAEERDADKLAVMYRVDHLATRMRRNAESLLVLADAKTPERHGPAVELREVLRVAIGEVEDYRRIVPVSFEDLSVPGHRAQDVAHLLAELMENATQQSPPGTAVDVTGGIEPTSRDYIISIIDHGTGIAADQLVALNELLAKPPTSTMAISHSIGLQVVSRLSHSLGIDVRLAPSPQGGSIAAVRIPAAVVAEWNGVNGTPSTPQVAPIQSMAPDAPMPTPLASDAPGAPSPLEAAGAVGVAGAATAAAAGAMPDLGVPDLGVPDLGVPDLGAPAAPDFGVPDLGVPDLGVPATPDLGVPDLGVPDLGVPDLGVPDLGAPAAPDFGVPDLGVPDLGAPAAPDFGVPDLGVPDLGAPAAPDLGVPDLGVPDLGVPDLGIADLGAPAAPDFGVPDLGVPDLGAPAAPDLGIPDLGIPDLGAPVAPTPIPDLAAPPMPEAPANPFEDVAPAPMPDLAAPPMPEAPANPFEDVAPAPMPEAPATPVMPEAPVAPVQPAAMTPPPAAPAPAPMPEAPVMPEAQAAPAQPAAPIQPAAMTPPPAAPAPAPAPMPEAPVAPAAPAFPAVTPVPTTPPAAPAAAVPQPDVAPAVAPLGAPAAAPAPAPAAPPAAPEVTSSGLTKRKRTSSTENAASLDGDRTAPSQRSPDQVRSMLSRYKTGLERGRGSKDGES